MRNRSRTGSQREANAKLLAGRVAELALEARASRSKWNKPNRRLARGEMDAASNGTLDAERALHRMLRGI